MNLVTGSTGILGIRLMTDLLMAGERVRGLKRPTSNTNTVRQIMEWTTGSQKLFNQVEWIDGDVLDVVSLADAMQGCEQVYHCAAVVSYHRKDRAEMYEVNVEGTANVVNVALECGISKLCFVSSIAAVGKQNNGSWLDEKSEWVESPYNSHYGISKHLSEMEVWRGIQEGLNAVVINPGIIIGPGEFSRSSASLFKKLHEGLSYYPPGGTGFVSVEDCSRFAMALMKKDITAERYILVSENLSMKEVFESVSGSLGKKIPDKQASAFILQLARIGEWFKEVFTGKKAVVTKESTRNASIRFYYHNEKAITDTGLQFTPVSKAITDTANCFKHIAKN